MDLPASIAGTDDYLQLLSTLWPFYDALEARLDSIEGLAGTLPDGTNLFHVKPGHVLSSRRRPLVMEGGWLVPPPALSQTLRE